MERRLLKFKMGKTGDVLVRYERINEEGAVDVITLESNELPKTELTDALNKMSDHLIEIVELPAEKKAFVVVTGVAITWKHDIQGLIITGMLKLKNSEAPMIINTPLFTEAPYSETDQNGKNVFSPACAADLDRLIEEALRYIDGNRAQPELDFEEEPGEEVEEPAVITG